MDCVCYDQQQQLGMMEQDMDGVCYDHNNN